MDNRSEYQFNKPPKITLPLSDNRLLGLWQLLRGFQGIYIVATLSLGVAALLRTGSLLWLKYLIDDVLPNSPQFGELARVALGFVAIAAIQGVFMFLSGAFAARSAEGVAQRLRNHLFDHIQRMKMEYHDITPTGDLLQRSTSDLDALRRFYADQFISAGRIILMFVVNFVAIAILDLRLALLSIIAIPIIVAISIFFFVHISRAYEAYQAQEAVLSTTLQENLTAIRVVKAFARQDFERSKFETENWTKYLRGRRLLTLHSLFWPTSDLLASMQMLAGFTIGALMTIAGQITIGAYIAYAGMLIWIIWPMRNLGRLIVQMSEGLVSYQRIVEIIRVNEEPLTHGYSDDNERLTGDIVFREVGFSYSDGRPALNNISIEIPPGSSLAIIGSTGSGKTSMVNLIPRFYEYNSGSITVDGRELHDYARGYLRDQIGIVEQEPFLFSRSIADNIRLGVKQNVSRSEIFEVAKAAAIHDDIQGFPQGYDTQIGEKGVTLSGGQKQRLAIARTLLKDPSILILDDSTSSVDTVTEQEIRRALERLMEGRTTLIISHRVQSAMGADKIIVLQDGAILQMGTHSELLKEEGTYQEIFRLQTEMEDALEKELTDG